MRMGTARLLVGMFAVTIVAAACGSSGTATPTTNAPTTTAAPSPSPSLSTPPPTSPSASSSGGGQITIGGDKANDHGSKDVSGASSVEVEMGDYFFGPTIITGTAGQKITIDLSNHGSALHNFSLTGQSIDQDVQVGGTATVTVTIPASGFVEFFCKYHKSLGMVGEVTAG